MRHRRARFRATAALVASIVALAGGAEMTVLQCSFDQGLSAAQGTEPCAAENVRFVDGHDGQGVLLDRPSLLTYPTDGLDPASFTVAFRVRHDVALGDLFYKRLTYFYHETPDMRNRIGVMKRAGSNALVFFMSDGQGRAKGDTFGGDWFAMCTGPFDWAAGTWHELVCTADRTEGIAQFFVDGRKVAEARGAQFPEQLGDVFWVGSQQGHSWMRGTLDELRVENGSTLRDEPVQAPSVARTDLPRASRLLDRSVGQVSGKELSINLDFFDICIGTDTWDLADCDREMDRLMALCAHYGIDRVFFRVSVCGAVCYHTRVMTPSYEDVFAKYTVEGLDGCCANIPSLHRRMGQVMRAIDPLAACAKAAHKHGMQVYAWVTVWDSLYYAPETEFFQQHPEFTWVSRDGTKHVPGVPCYAYPEVREYRLAQVRELLEYDVDGVMFSPRSHSPWPGRRSGGGNEGARGYGFNEPVVKEYVRRYGKDPRGSEPDSLDELRFVQLKADLFNQFLRETKALTDAAQKKLVMVTSPSISDPVAANWMYVDADTIARERIVDELCMMAGANYDLNHWRLLADGEMKVTTWAGIHGRTYDECMTKMRTQCRAMLDNVTSDGSTYHELANLVYPDCWEEAIIDVVREWQGSAAGERE